MKIKILYVIENVFFGGGERAFAQIARGLDRNRYDIAFVCSSGGELENMLKGAGIRMIPLDFHKRFSIRTFLKLISIIKREMPDIVHSQGARVDFQARIAARIVKKPAMVTTVAMPVDGYNVGNLKKAIYIILDSFTELFVDRFIVVSKKLRHYLVDHHNIDPNRVMLIHNGIELDEYDTGKVDTASFKAEFGIREDELLVGTIGRLVWQKGLPYFIDAAAQVHKSNPAVRFFIVGDGELMEELKKQADKKNISENIVFTGFRNDVRNIIASLDLVVLSSVRECMPIIILEAMAMSKPVVATDIDGINEVVINNKSGLLVPSAEPSQLAHAIIDMLDNKDKAMGMGREGRRAVEAGYSISKAVSEHVSLYDMIHSQKIADEDPKPGKSTG